MAVTESGLLHAETPSGGILYFRLVQHFEEASIAELEHNDLDATELFKQISEDIGELIGIDEMRRLRTAMESLNYKLALAILHGHRNTLTSFAPQVH